MPVSLKNKCILVLIYDNVLVVQCGFNSVFRFALLVVIVLIFLVGIIQLADILHSRLYNGDKG